MKKQVLVLLIIMCIALLTGCYPDYPMESDVRSIEERSIPASMYWLEARGTEASERAICLVGYDLERHVSTRIVLEEGSERTIEEISMVETNHPGGVVAVAQLNSSDYEIYAFDEAGSFRSQYCGSVARFSSADALYDGVLYYCDGYQSYRRDLSTGKEDALPDEIRLGGMCVSPDGGYFDCLKGEDDDQLVMRIVDGASSTSAEYEFPEGTKPDCRFAVWKDQNSVLLAIGLQIDRVSSETRLYMLSAEDGSLQPWQTEQGEELVLDRTNAGLLVPDSLQVDPSGKYISYMCYRSLAPSMYRNIDVYVQSLADGEKYLVDSILTGDGRYQVEMCPMAVWG